jgi:hypothetical protein
MDELREIWLKYKDIDFDEKLSNFDSLVDFSAVFYRDVAEIYDAVIIEPMVDLGRIP